MDCASILHAHSTFEPGGKELRTVRLINALGGDLHHTLLVGDPERVSALDALDPAARFELSGSDAPALLGRPALARYRALAQYMRQFDLVLSYSWGAMDLVMAHRLFARRLSLPLLIHHEDGFDEDEAVRRNWRRNLYRWLALPSARALVVPSRLLDRIARNEWGVPAGKIRLIDNGIDLARFAGQAAARSPRQGPLTVGTVAGLRAVKNIRRLVRMVALAGDDLRLTIAGEGSDRAAIEAEIAAQGMAQRVTLLGHVADPSPLYRDFDIFALSSDSEQAPIALVEAMASGLPVVSTDVGDVAAMVSEPNRRFVKPREDLVGLSDALRELAGAPHLRGALGEANAAKALAQFDEQTMVANYRALYGEALNRPIT
ncbi:MULTISPECIES: glycosyltransferase family 4 protein [unclassified Novosphingobium]|uniref:glycosyltransferase family 4 protein n=1 Tax=unclassified Novosphingobium TaxID=2644732 RepID=UPI000EE2F526|nr:MULTISPECIES: glycosyltransferase family 4 protein [unclassified Novosphingobium]HCF24573.1 glycosyl transferase family 1 [Novosphingobium sp.]HQV03669.1 glycosyltransferase family 4 protein [Novosphingobium sp.]